MGGSTLPNLYPELYFYMQLLWALRNVGSGGVVVGGLDIHACETENMQTRNYWVVEFPIVHSRSLQKVV